MNFHILNGDSLAQTFYQSGIGGEVIVFREGLIDGDLSGDNLNTFWQTRAGYMGLSTAEYNESVVQEFEKILTAPEESEFHLWFEYDLFCQVNMWFIISLLRNRPVKQKVHAVYSSYLDVGDKRFWNGFGPATTKDLLTCLQEKITLSASDLQMGYSLWTAYKNSDLAGLQHHARNTSSSFPHLEEVVKAHLERFAKEGKQGRPERVLEEIMSSGPTDVNRVFQEFWKRESIYGFGDVQLKRLYDKLLHNTRREG